MEQLFAALATDQRGYAQQPDHTYTYLFCDLLTDELIAELPLASVSYSTELNGIGTLTATIPYSDDTLPLDPDNASTPARTALYVDRDGVIVWGGIVWTRRLVTAGKEIQAAEFASYYQHRYIKTTLSTDPSLITDTDLVPDGQRLYADQKYLVWSLLRYAHTQPGGDIGIETAALTGTAHGVTRSMTYQASERPEIFRSIIELGAADDGYDFGIEVGWTPMANNQPPRRYRRAQAWFPRRGRTATESGLVFVKGGPESSILSYDWPENGAAMATEMSVLGEGSGDVKPAVVVQDADRLASGWPLLEAVASYDGVTDLVQLQGLADAELTGRSAAQTKPTFSVSADADPRFGSYQVGDEALFVIEPEPLMAAGREGVLRIISIENTAAAGPETVRLTCAGV